jgi:hypothetical protein
MEHVQSGGRYNNGNLTFIFKELMMKTVKAVTMLLIILFLTACASVSTNFGPKYLNKDTGKPQQNVNVEFTSTNAVAPSTTDNVMLECEPPAGVESMEKMEGLEKSLCSTMSGNHDAGPGVLPSIGSAVVQSGGFAYGMHEMGKGLKGSGDNTSIKSEGGHGGLGGLGVGDDYSPNIRNSGPVTNDYRGKP